MKSKTNIVSKLGIAGLAYIMVAGSSFSWAAERPHHDGDSDRGPRHDRVEQQEHRSPEGERGVRQFRGRRGPNTQMRQEGDRPDQGRRMGQRPSQDQPRQRGEGFQQRRGAQRFGSPQVRRDPGDFRRPSFQGQRRGNPEFSSFRRFNSQRPNRPGDGFSRFRGRMMSQGFRGGMIQRRAGRAMAMRRMSQAFRGDQGHPFMRGESFRGRRGPGASEERSHFQKRSPHGKGKGRHSEIRGKRGKDSKHSAMKDRGSKKNRPGNHKKGIQKRRGGENKKGQGRGGKRNRNRNS